MAGPSLNIEECADRILAEGKIVEVESVGKDELIVDAGDAHLLVEKALPSGIRLTGKRSVLVRGNFEGSDRYPSRIDVSGEVVVTGSVRNARLSGDRVFVGGAASGSQVKAVVSVDIGGDTQNLLITAGDFETRLEVIRDLEVEISRLNEKREVDARGLSIRQRELYRISTMARLTLDVGLGQIIQDDGARLFVDLQPFYKITASRTEEDIDKAIDQFFNKVVVGMLAKTNRVRLRESVSRQTTFKHLVRQLHELFLATRKRDLLDRQSEETRRRFDEQTVSLCATEAAVQIYGHPLAGTEIRFKRPLVTAGDRLKIDEETAFIKVDSDPSGESVVFATDVESQKRRLAELDRGTEFRLEENGIPDKPIG